MPDRKGYERMLELTASIQHALRELEAGRLDAEGLDRCTEEARALYERLVVLRHKLREAALAAAAQPSEPAAPSTQETSIRLETRPPGTPTRQTSLIDAIAETEQATRPQRQPPKPKDAEKKPGRPATGASVVDRLEHAPVADLHKAISLSQKFWFVAELFAGQRERYEKAVDAINAAADLTQARAFIDREVLAPLPKPPGNDVLATFLELVQRRFA